MTLRQAGLRNSLRAGFFHETTRGCRREWVGFSAGMERPGERVPYKRKLIKVALPLDAN